MGSQLSLTGVQTRVHGSGCRSFVFKLMYHCIPVRYSFAGESVQLMHFHSLTMGHLHGAQQCGSSYRKGLRTHVNVG